MKSYRPVQKDKALLPKTVWLAFLVVAVSLAAVQTGRPAPNVLLWDTGKPLNGSLTNEGRAGWKAVPSDIIALEADPLKASSDPGYYGREYSFGGDAVVENSRLAAVFLSGKGRVVLYAKEGADRSDGDSQANRPMGKKFLEIAPLQTEARSTTIRSFEILRNAEDEVVLKVVFSVAGSKDASGIFAFGKTEIVEIKPVDNMERVGLFSAMEYGVVPSFIGDDLIYGPAEYGTATTLSVPSEYLLLGLLQGEDQLLVVTWPKGSQHLRLQLGNDQPGKRLIQCVDFATGGQSLYVAALSAPGIWHKEALTLSFLEKDLAIQWKRPFPARWKTQLYEEAVKTTFTFRASKGDVWRGVPGSYTYPVWFNGEQAYYHLSKKVPPKGESLIYFLEGSETPLWISTPADILKATLGRPMSESLLDVAGRKLRTHHRRGGEGVHRACTCGCTEAIQAVFEAGEETTRKDYISGALDDMVYFVRRHVERIDEYQRFAKEVTQLLQAKENASPELKPFVEELLQTAQRIPEEYNVQKENMKSLAYADELTRQTLALTAAKSTNNLAAYMELLKAWRGMGGAQDYVVAQCHILARKLCQEAGYGCATEPKAVALAEEIRARCRQCLRNADGYEIWADY